MNTKQKTNYDHFKKVFDHVVLAPGILREALKHYINFLEDSEGWEGGFIHFDRWLSDAKETKELLDKCYQDAGHEEM